MIKQNQRLLNLLSKVADFLLLFAAYLLSTYIRFDVMYGAAPALEVAWNPAYFRTAAVCSLLIVLFYQYMKLYAPKRARRFWKDALVILWGNIMGVFLLTAFLYITRIADFSRIAIALYLGLSTLLVGAKHWAVRRLLRAMRRRGYNLKHVVLVGNGTLAHQYVKAIRDNPGFGFTVDGYLCRTQREALGRHLGVYEDLGSLLASPGIDEVVIALEPHETDLLPHLIAVCEKYGTRASIIPFFNDYTPDTLSVDLVGSCKLINLRASPLDSIAMQAVKRGFDILGSLLLLLLFSPFMLVAAIGTKLSSPGPIIFKQERVGLDKRPFMMYKFRSMRVNDREASGWTTNQDPRKTRFGSLLRKTSIDETPQFFNVLKGDMSLVGPRPEVPHFVEQFRETIPLYMVKHQVRPGITGWAQINGYRGDTSIEERVKHDIWYIENWSFALDLSILLRTVFGGMVNREKVR